MIFLEKVLLGIALLLIGITMLLFHKSTKENSSFWYGKWRDFISWEKAQKRRENEDNHN